MDIAENPNWLQPEKVNAPAELIEFCQGSRYFAEILMRRGFHSKKKALPFLFPHHYQASDPFDFPMMHKAVQKTADTISKEQTIGIWGDFDADGQTATALLVEALSRLTPLLVYHIPVRAQNSHGINIDGLNHFIEKNVSLIITCDTGISEHEEIDYAANNGMETIITDHHKLPEVLPRALAIINPHCLNPDHPMASLSGVGVAYKFIEALYQHLEKPPAWLEGLLDLVAIGTISDLVPLENETRYLTQIGMDFLRETSRPGLLALYEHNGIRQKFINEETISFSIAPRLNAMGRLGNANKNIQLLTTPSSETAGEMMIELERLNNERKKLSELITSAAISMIEQSRELAKQPFIFLSSPEWETSITGVVASALAERYKRPAFVISTQQGKQARGSARSIQGTDIAQVLNENDHWLLRYGGHAMASGFALETDRLNEFRRGVEKSVSKQMKAGYAQEPIKIDAYVPLQEATKTEFVEQMELLRPLGPSNPPVTLLDTNLRLLNVYHFGKSENHRRITVETKFHTQHSVIWWKSADEPFPSDCFNLLFTVKFSHYRGRREVQLEYIDAKACELNNFDHLTISPAIAIIDMRNEPNPIGKIREISTEKSAMVYAEGFYHKTPDFEAFNRFEIQPCEVLVIATIPPDYKTLHGLIEAASPKKLILLKPVAGKQSKTAFISYLTDCLLVAINSRHGILDINNLAAASGHAKSTVMKALDFLVERTTLHYIDKNCEQVQIGNFGKPGPNAKSRMLEMDDLLEETAAFRRFYMRSDLQNVIQAIGTE